MSVGFVSAGITANARRIKAVFSMAFNPLLCDENLSLLCGGMHDYKLKNDD